MCQNSKFGIITVLWSFRDFCTKNYPQQASRDSGRTGKVIYIIFQKTYTSFNGHGIDVAVKRADDLDKLSLEHLGGKNSPKVLDLGCGAGGHSVRMTEAGVLVTAIDEHDFSITFDQYRKEKGFLDSELEFICGDIVNLPELIPERIFDDAYMQRTLHYLKYDKALKLLVYLYGSVKDRLYISVTGMESGVGEVYKGKDIQIENRIFRLCPEIAKIYSIHEPICLYTKKEFVEILETSGWRVESSWQSAFGNIKAVCSH